MSKDFTTNDNEGVDYEYIDGIAGKALNAKDFVGLTNPSYNLVFGSEFALSIWFNRKFSLFFSGFELNIGYLLEIKGDLNFGGETFLKVTSETYSYSSYYYSAFSSISSVTTRQPALTDGQFHHVVIQRKYQGTDGITEFYLDGVNVDLKTQASPLMVGRENQSSVMTLFLRGTAQENAAVDQLRIYHRSLSTAEIAALNNETN